jgi:hypothetical protein
MAPGTLTAGDDWVRAAWAGHQPDQWGLPHRCYSFACGGSTLPVKFLVWAVSCCRLVIPELAEDDMPILPPEPDQYPESLFEDPSLKTNMLAWWVLHTRPRQEKSLGRELYQAKAPFYLPLMSHRFLSRGRTLQSHIPVFGGYVFLLADHEKRSKALSTNRVANSLSVPDQAEMWQDLTNVHRLISSGLPITAADCLEPGTPVEIKTGPLTGLQGVILERASVRRFLVKVDFIHRGASVLLDDVSLKAIGEVVPLSQKPARSAGARR